MTWRQEVASRTASPASIRCGATRSEHSGSCAGNSQTAASFLRPSGGGPFTPDAVNRLIKRIGERAGFAFPVHCHMLRHACGYALANAGHDTRALQDWLGHRSIQHTVRYTELSPTRFKDFWRD